MPWGKVGVVGKASFAKSLESRLVDKRLVAKRLAVCCWDRAKVRG